MRLAILWAVIALVVTSDADARAGESPLFRIGSKRFTESYILAEVAMDVARAAGDARVSHVQGIGGTALVYRALEEGSIDAYPEYTGTIAEAVLHAPGLPDDAIRRALAARGIEMTDSLGFDNTYALAVPAALATARHLRTISDLAKQHDLRFGFSHEFLGRSDGFPALAARYGLPTDHVQALDHGLAYQALSRGALDVIDVYSTDAEIGRYGLRVLEDDRGFFPSYQAVILYRADAARRAPRAIAAIRGLAGSIDNTAMISLNAEVEVDGRTFASVAQKFVASRGGEGGEVHLESRPSLWGGLIATMRAEGPRHVALVVAALLAATLVGIPLGIAARWLRRLGRVVLAATSVVQTIPSLALLCFFIPVLGTGPLAALAALFLYALLPITRNTVAGLDAIPAPLRESAEALGLGRWEQLVWVELPLASRTILAGMRTSAVISVGTATLAAFIGAGGFGAPISVGLNLDDTRLILEGAIPAAVLALLVEGIFAALDRTVIPKGLRLGDSGAGDRDSGSRPASA